MRGWFAVFAFAVVLGIPIGTLAVQSNIITLKDHLFESPPPRFKAISLDRIGPSQQAWLVQDLKHPEQCVLVLQEVAFTQLPTYTSATVAGMVSQPWPCL